MKNKLEEARNIINEVDAKMAELFCLRMQASRLVAEHKQQHGLPIFDTLDMAWREGKLTEATLLSPADTTVRMKDPRDGRVVTRALAAHTPLTLYFE